MKKPLDGKTAGIILGVVGVVVVIAAFMYFKPEFGPGKPEVPKPYIHPGASGYGPNGAGNPTPDPNAPIGAPAAPK